MLKRVKLRKTKPILSLDFDGVCHSYTSGWQDIDVLPDDPVEGLFEFLEEANEEFTIQIFSTRSREEAGIQAMKDWFVEHTGDSEILDILEFPSDKPLASVGLDDRVLTFAGEWPDVQDLVDFEPWNKQEE